MSTSLRRAGANLLTSGGLLLTASTSYSAYGLAPTPGYALARETPLSSSKVLYTIPGLSTATAATAFVVVNKVPSVEDLRMICSIITQGDSTRTWAGYTGKNYQYNGGITANTYQPAFVNIKDKTVLDNGRTILLTIKFGHGGVVFYINGELAAIESTGELGNRPWSDDFMLGGEPSSSTYDWQGLLSACYLYLTDLSDVDRTRTEGYLLASYPAIS